MTVGLCRGYISTVKIAGIQIESLAFLAPMAGYTNSAFRQLCKEMGAGFVFTEFVSSEGIIRESQKTFNYLQFNQSERPIGIQLFGHNPKVMAEAARIIDERYRPDVIDLNFGCSVRKVVKKDAGAALLKNPSLLQSVAQSVVKAVKTPVTAKIRAGWNHQSIVALDVARILENAGVTALTIHPRTASDGYRGTANWNLIAEVKNLLSIPVIGNGDIKHPEDAVRMRNETGCDAVMIGRAAIGNPWIFEQVKQLLNGNYDYFKPGLSDKLDMCLKQIEYERQISDDEHVNRIMKKYYRHYINGFPNASDIRNRLVRSESIREAINIINEIKSLTTQ